MSSDLRAPAQHGDILLHPSESLTALTHVSEAALERVLGAERSIAREEILPIARLYTSQLVGRCDLSADPKCWIVGGHQPELFHPGVWAKNAVISQLAEITSGVGLHLIVDHDLCPGAAVRVPTAPQSRTMTTIDWDVPLPQSPWEERGQPDAERFGSFGERCGDHLRAWGIDPLASSQNWRGCNESSLVDRVVHLRATFEHGLGWRNLELRVSELSETRAFRRFVAQVLSGADSFRIAYHRALFRYRERNRVRSASHPVPELVSHRGRIEVPFWVWRSGDQQRGKLYVEATSDNRRRLYADQREVGSLSLESSTSGVEGLEQFSKTGWKIRPRALTLTLFSRLYLSSVFVHGIGGAKYDEMTDELMQSWFGIRPPPIIVATATLRLFEQFAGPNVDGEIATIQHELRRLQWNPESLVVKETSGIQWDQRRKEKSELLASNMTPALRHRTIQEINAVFRAVRSEEDSQLRTRLRQLIEQRPYQMAIRSREFSANLYPADDIRRLFEQVLKRVNYTPR